MLNQVEISSSEDGRDEFFQFLEGAMERSLPDEIARETFYLTVVEAVNNAAEHGNKNDPGKKILVDYFLGPEVAVMLIKDQGPGFTPGFVDLKSVRSRRGRGLSLIRENVDVFFFNFPGNRITLIKGGETMYFEGQDVQAGIHRLSPRVTLASGLTFGESKVKMTQGMAALMEEILGQDAGRIWLDCSRVKMLNSSAWGVLYADAERGDVECIVLFNAREVVVNTARQMGFGAGEGPGGKIRVFGDEKGAMELLVQSLAG